jgi:hypothetical protein
MTSRMSSTNGENGRIGADGVNMGVLQMLCRSLPQRASTRLA